MKLTNIAKEALKEAESKAAQQAHHLGLEPSAYGNWKDPQSGEVVAKSVKGGEALIKTQGEEEPDGTEPEETDELPEPSPDNLEEPEDLLAPEAPVASPEDEYVPPESAVVPTGDVGGGDVNRALSVLAKKFHDAQGNPELQAAIKDRMEKVKQAEEAEKQHMIDTLAKIQAKKDAQKMATREKMAKNPKYASLLNNPNKDL